MNRTLYSGLWWLALPAVLGRLWWRGRKEPGYREHWGERLALGGPAEGQATIVLHAVSVGETRAAEPVVDALLKAYPDCRILLTHMTPTGRATGRQLFAHHGERVVQAYLPYDTGSMTRRFLRRHRPRAVILMETEVWPNLLHACARMDVPVVLANARLSERSLRRGQKAGAVMQEAARAFTLVAAQTELDAARIRSLGASNVEVTGSVKFDVTPPASALEKGDWLRSHIRAGGPERPVFLCASTREGEEVLILDAWQRLADKPAGSLLLLVPRHPQRFDEVADLVTARGMRLARRSQLDLDHAIDGADVLLGDSMGEMFAYYAACDCAYIGGSLLPLGGQNLIEACALGKPVLVGEHTFNFLDATIEAVGDGAALRVKDADALANEAARLLRDHAARMEMGARALAFARRHRGATLRTVELLQRVIR
ncbi:lipid IV(A) 3-deoxy-D-manno-octulosonic acid transferase [Massilia sp. YIM B02443]|uniref:lipid IV(A) 3-deoxy-D-manno-octulosonic acid transferase n=1 Tax=Massilia sp. YIM B02443 TaxID=3050127 RepID=UPI0025B72764|nr:lipid IV(A) 3-deoxy-D-manno-octulosonic acid transferase [Massilia sp. YIM B02443]MDN4036963.1 lipid IV(A) 3-deoxy-D-manno-octulosonic acid transferase [Massilia sp. YIM B02443]